MNQRVPLVGQGRPLFVSYIAMQRLGENVWAACHKKVEQLVPDANGKHVNRLVSQRPSRRWIIKTGKGILQVNPISSAWRAHMSAYHTLCALQPHGARAGHVSLLGTPKSQCMPCHTYFHAAEPIIAAFGSLPCPCRPCDRLLPPFMHADGSTVTSRLKTCALEVVLMMRLSSTPSTLALPKQHMVCCRQQRAPHMPCTVTACLRTCRS